jgi:hypothetical protein
VDVSLPSEQQIEQLRHWLDLLTTYLTSDATSNYSILLVGTKIDKLSSKDDISGIADVLISEFKKWKIDLARESIIFISNQTGTGRTLKHVVKLRDNFSGISDVLSAISKSSKSMVKKDKQTPVIFRKIEEAVERLFSESKLPVFCSLKDLRNQATQLLKNELKEQLLSCVKYVTNSSHLIDSLRVCMTKAYY